VRLPLLDHPLDERTDCDELLVRLVGSEVAHPATLCST
jgi:hypothetical protein